MAASAADRRLYFLGESEPIQRLRANALRLADAPFPILITGESGTGKYELAMFLHAASLRAKEPFVDVHCATLSETLFESELFGHERGAFTDARERHVGLIERAGSGTLLFDEIDCLAERLQGKLLRFVDRRLYERIGGRESLSSRAALLFASNRPLEDLVESGEFRFDLFSRINWMTLEIPPLRARPKDVAFLANVFLEETRFQLRRATLRWSAAALDGLRQCEWKGNVRELRAVSTILGFLHAGTGVVSREEVDELLKERQRNVANVVRPFGLRDVRGEAEREVIAEALRRTSGNRVHAARLLNIGRRTLQTKITRYRL